MADTFRFELVSPERILMSADMTQVDVPGAEGDFGVLANHAPVIATLKPGVLSVKGGPDGDSEIFVRGGFAEVGPESLTVLAEQALPLDEVDAKVMAQEIQNAEEDVADAKDDVTREKAELQLSRLQAVNEAFKTAGRA